MEELRQPCAHRGSSCVFTSPMDTPEGPIDLCLCSECRRFWLERNGWLLSRREAMSLLRSLPDLNSMVTLAR